MGYDNVKNPSHYVEGRQFEPKDVIRDWGLNFNLGNAVKYLSRAGRKGDAVEDLKKAQEYIQFELDAMAAERSYKKYSEEINNVLKTREAQKEDDKKAVDEKIRREQKKPMDVAKAQCGVIELVVPKNMPLEDVIQMAISKIMGVEG